MGQIARAAIAPGEADPLADDPQVTLRGTGGVGGAEGCRVQFRPGGQVVRDGALRQLGWDVAARILQQRDEIVGRVTDRRTLEVEHADAADARALRQPQQVAGEEVAMDEAERAGGDRCQHRLECRGEVLAGGVRCGGAEHRRPPPVEQRRQGSGRHRRGVPGREVGRRRGALDGDQGVDGRSK